MTTCGNCGLVYPMTTDVDEALAETARDYPGVPESEMMVVCHGCYQKLQFLKLFGDNPIKLSPDDARRVAGTTLSQILKANP